MAKVRVALCQMKIGDKKEDNLSKAKLMLERAADDGAEIVVLPEMFNCPYDIHCFRNYAEKLPYGVSGKMLAEVAREKTIFIIGGSVPELGDNDVLYNTSLIFNSAGEVIGKHRKAHLFDVHVKNGIQFMESKVLSSGNQVTLVDTPWGKIGVMICYDIRFPEFSRVMALSDAQMIFVPAAFNLTTGPAHWETLFKSRALDNQVFVLGNSPARNEQASYVAYGHSIVVNPWGQIIQELDEGEGILAVELDLEQIKDVREALPVWRQRRVDLY